MPQGFARKRSTFRCYRQKLYGYTKNKSRFCAGFAQTRKRPMPSAVVGSGNRTSPPSGAGSPGRGTQLLPAAPTTRIPIRRRMLEHALRHTCEHLLGSTPAFTKAQAIRVGDALCTAGERPHRPIGAGGGSSCGTAHRIREAGPQQKPITVRLASKASLPQPI